MLESISTFSPTLVFLLLSFLLIVKRVVKFRFPYDSYLNYLWAFSLIFAVSEAVSFEIAIWILAFLCFMALREFFTLVDLRIQDRWGIWGAYLSIPLMIFFIQMDYYGLFIISIPVYGFLAIPFLVTLGGKEFKGTLLSIGIIDLGLFLLVYCIGHIGYLALFSTWWAIMLITDVAVCDVIALLLRRWKNRPWISAPSRCLISIPITVGITMALSYWTGIPWLHCIILGVMIPVLAAVGRHTIRYIEKDLGISRDQLHPGRGQVLDNLRSLLYAAPVVFHYLRFFSMRTDVF
jgi:phosphatidate cytidylyltransferase